MRFVLPFCIACITAVCTGTARGQAPCPGECPETTTETVRVINAYYDFGPDTMQVVPDKVNIIFMGDGFTSESYYGDSPVSFDAWVERSKQVILAMEPYKTWGCAFNFSVVDVLSEQTGADQPWNTSLNTADRCRDTELNCWFDGHWLESCTPERVVKAAGYANINWHVVIVLVNSDEWGGSAYPDDGIMYTSIADGGRNFEVTLTHELGHVVGGLLYEGGLHDEYYWPVNCDVTSEPTEPNVTMATDRASVKWHEFLTIAQEDWVVPTPEAAGEEAVGIFEGAAGCDKGVYRPQLECHMHYMQIHDQFCAVCYDVLAQALSARCPKATPARLGLQPLVASSTMLKQRKTTYGIPECWECVFLGARVGLQVQGRFPPATDVVVRDLSGGVVATLDRIDDTFSGEFVPRRVESHVLEITMTPDDDALNELTISVRMWIGSREIELPK